MRWRGRVASRRGVSLAVTALSFMPVSWPAFAAGNLLIGLTHAATGFYGPLPRTKPDARATLKPRP